MNCEEVLMFLERDPGQPDRGGEGEAVRAHIEGCATCAEARQSLADLRDRVAGLPRSVEPRRDLWPEIEARIASGNVVRARFGRRALMAAAAAVLLVSSILTAYLVGRHQAVSAVLEPTPAAATASDVLLASFAELGVHDYQATRQQLLDVIEQRKGELSPATMEVVLANLRLIDDAMAEIAAALGEDPGNELLRKRLVATYRRQINLLETAAILPSQA